MFELIGSWLGYKNRVTKQERRESWMIWKPNNAKRVEGKTSAEQQFLTTEDINGYFNIISNY